MLILTAAARHAALQRKTAVAAVAGTRHARALAAALDHSSQHDSSSRSSGAIAAAAAVAAAAALGLPRPAHAEADDTINSSSNAGAAQQFRFTSWLTRHGADLSAVAVQPSKASGGLGLFATTAIKQHMSHSWLGRRLGAMLLRGAENQTVSVASFPLGLSLTVETALAHPQLGPNFAELLELGLIDERTAVVLLLLVEQQRGEDSPYAPWLQLLPIKFDTPLFYSEPQLQELSGTTLAAATAARQAALSRSWQQLKPAVEQMLQQVGVSTAPAYDDYLWATSIFWSRGLALPVTYTEQQHAGDSSSSSSSSSGGSSDSDSGSDGSGDSSSSGVLRIKVLEGLVPGLDFANHSQQPKCWWEVEAVSTAQRSMPDQQQQQQQQQQQMLTNSQHMVKLMANRACCPKAREELTMSYGDKGNEELLLLYGFAQPQNPHETLMVLCPLPSPDEWDDVFAARMELLQAKGLRPQLFLSAAHLESTTGQPLLLSPVAPAPESDSSSTAAAAADSSSSSGSSSGSKKASKGGQHSSIVPDAARQVLEVFVLDRRELAAALQQQQQHGTDNSNSSSSSQIADPVQQKMQQLGLQMAILTTFARLLELKMISMEGEEGTGPLESDLEQLAAAQAAAAGMTAAQQQSGGSGGWGSGGSSSADGGESLPGWKRHCLLYRAGQKALVRSYITAARAELQATLAELQALMEANGYSS